MTKELIFILLLSTCSLTGVSVASSQANLTCTQQQCYGRDGEISVVCSCTAACNETIYWWDNNTATFCHESILNTSDVKPQNSNQDPVVYGVIKPTECNSSNTFTSCLAYNTSVSMEDNTYIQIGCFIIPDALPPNSTSPFPTNESCSPVREPMDWERSSNMTWNISSCRALNPTPTSTPTAQPTTSGDFPGAVAGGVVGGTILITIAIVTVLVC